MGNILRIGSYCSAWAYQNEAEVGKAIRECRTPRSELFITVLDWRLGSNDRLNYGVHIIPEQKKDLMILYTNFSWITLIVHFLRLSIVLMKVYLMHWPIPLPADKELIPSLPNGDRRLLDEKEWTYIDTWKSMEKLLNSGKCKAIGVSNMSISYLERLIKECEVVPAVNQVECHPLLPQHELLSYCNKHGILLQAYSPLGSSDSPLLSDPDIKKIADAHGATVGQILISWQGFCLFNNMLIS